MSLQEQTADDALGQFLSLTEKQQALIRRIAEYARDMPESNRIPKQASHRIMLFLARNLSVDASKQTVLTKLRDAYRREAATNRSRPWRTLNAAAVYAGRRNANIRK